MAIVYAAGTPPRIVINTTPDYKRAWVRGASGGPFWYLIDEVNAPHTGPLQVRLCAARLTNRNDHYMTIGGLRVHYAYISYWSASTQAYVKVSVDHPALWDEGPIRGREIVVQFLDPGWRVWINSEIVWETDLADAVRLPAGSGSVFIGSTGALPSYISEIIVSDSLNDNLIGSYVADATWTETERGAGWLGGKAQLEQTGTTAASISCTEVDSTFKLSAVPMAAVTVPGTVDHRFALTSRQVQGDLGVNVTGLTATSGALLPYQSVPVSGTTAGATVELFT